MPKRFTPEELEASAAAGAPRNEASFAGDATAWHSYQDAFFKTIKLGEELPPYGDACRAALWKAARRQRGKIEEQRVEGRQAESNTERMRAARRDDEYRSREALAKRKQAEAEKRVDEAFDQLYDRQMAHFVHLLREAGVEEPHTFQQGADAVGLVVWGYYETLISREFEAATQREFTSFVSRCMRAYWVMTDDHDQVLHEKFTSGEWAGRDDLWDVWLSVMDGRPGAINRLDVTEHRCFLPGARLVAVDWEWSPGWSPDNTCLFGLQVDAIGLLPVGWDDWYNCNRTDAYVECQRGAHRIARLRRYNYRDYHFLPHHAWAEKGDVEREGSVGAKLTRALSHDEVRNVWLACEDWLDIEEWLDECIATAIRDASDADGDVAIPMADRSNSWDSIQRLNQFQYRQKPVEQKAAEKRQAQKKKSLKRL